MNEWEYEKREIIHKKIIDLFGRYPHPNEVLGRKSTPEEENFFAPQRYTTLESEEGIQVAKESSYAFFDKNLTHLDQLIGEDNHVYKNKRTIADPYAYVMAKWSEMYSKTWEDYPNLARFMRAMVEDESVQKVYANHNK